MPSAASAIAAAGEMFSSSRSLTTTRATDARIRGGEALREFDVLFAQARIVGRDLFHRSTTARHLANVSHREPRLRERRFATEDFLALDKLLLPPLELGEAFLDIVHGRVELHDHVRTEIEIARLLPSQRADDHPV